MMSFFILRLLPVNFQWTTYINIIDILLKIFESTYLWLVSNIRCIYKLSWVFKFILSGQEFLTNHRSRLKRQFENFPCHRLSLLAPIPFKAFNSVFLFPRLISYYKLYGRPLKWASEKSKACLWVNFEEPIRIHFTFE